jgi:hypothetical protein
MKISISAANPAKYYWMRYAGAKSRTVLSEKGDKHVLAPKALFGVRELRNKEYDEIVLEDGSKFQLKITKSENLMNASKQYNGKIPTLTSAKPTTRKSSAAPTSPVKQKAIPITKLGTMLKVSTPKPAAVVHKDPRKAVVTKMTGVTKPGNPDAPRTVKVKLSELHLPEIEDFNDDEIPEEFRRYKTVESTGVRVEKISISFVDPTIGDDVPEGAESKDKEDDEDKDTEVKPGI